MLDSFALRGAQLRHAKFNQQVHFTVGQHDPTFCQMRADSSCRCDPLVTIRPARVGLIDRTDNLSHGLQYALLIRPERDIWGLPDHDAA